MDELHSGHIYGHVGHIAHFQWICDVNKAIPIREQNINEI